MAKKNTIKLTESELKKIISESVKNVLKENNDRPLTQLCFALINGNLKSNIEVYEGDFEGSIDVTVTFNGGEINASGYGYEDGDDFELASATIQWNGGTAYVSEGEPIASKLSKTISLLMQDRGNEGDFPMESKRTKKNVVKLTESKLKKIISESVKKVLKESMYDTNDGFTSSTTYDMQKGNTQQSQVPQFKHVRELDQVSRKRLMDIINEVLYDDKGYFHGSDTDILAKRLNMTEDEMERNGLMDIIRDTIECELEAGNLY
jgi:hypothetical protein